MKNFITANILTLKSLSEVLSHMFATNGNGVYLDNRGFLIGNYRGQEAYPIPSSPQPFNWIYPWSKSERFQPFRKLAGCRDTGFKECASYFIDCIVVTPDDVDNIKEWKENIDIVRQVLLDTPTIEDPFTDPEDTYSFVKSLSEDLRDIDPSAKSTVRKVNFFDVQSSGCPIEVVNEVRQLWSAYELGNDHYIYKTELDLELFDEYPRIYYWLKMNGIKENEQVLIHYWW